MRNFIPFIDKILRFFFGSKQERDLKRLSPIAELIGLLERTVHNRPQEWFEKRTAELRELIEEGEGPGDRRQYYEKILRDAQEKLTGVNVEESARKFADLLRENRAELTEKYDGDAFLGAIESPLAEKNVKKLEQAYAERLRGWQAEDVDELLEQFNQLWDHFVSEAPEEQEAKNLWFVLPEAFAMVREVAHRRLGLRHYPVQLIGAVVLHRGRIAEMKTGEGKTLVATMPLYLNALTGKGAHLVTVNDYLAQRDSRWMGEIYERLGVSVGLIQNGMKPEERAPEYQCDITYGTNNEFGFDYLRDNMAVRPEDMVQRGHNYAIIDEIDSVLIDEARTPLIISGRAGKPASLYKKVDKIVAQLKNERDYEVDEEKNSVSLLDPGSDRVEEAFDIENLYSTANMELVHHVHQAIRARELFARDAEYVVKDNQVIIVDQFTGRLQPGRRFSDGLHQAIEAKEGVKIKRENKTLSTITIQNFFRMYDKLAGMTGTADTEAEEFQEIYNLDVVVVPTNKPDIRVDKEDAIYRTKQEKYNAVIDEIERLHENGKPVLVGTIDIDTSELLGHKLSRRGVEHEILNAKNHEREAAIVAQAGQPGAVTIATNMAGRGTDIVLGDGVIEEECPEQPENPDEAPFCPHEPICGLHVVGTERHESRRIDNQLRGRTARQGDPGASRFFVSLEDDLMRLFGSDRISGMLQKLGLEQGQRIEHGLISRSIKKAQSKVESRNFEIRKRLLEFDDVLDRQRKIIFRERNLALHEEDLSDEVERFIKIQVEDWIDYHAEDRRPAEDWPLSELLDDIENLIAWSPPEEEVEEWQQLRAEELEPLLFEKLLDYRSRRHEKLGEEMARRMEKQLLLKVIDTHWKEHIDAMDSLKQGIQLESMAQKDPLVEYKRQGFRMFDELQVRIREDFLRFIYQIEAAEEKTAVRAPDVAEYKHDSIGGLSDLVSDSTAAEQQKAVRSGSAGGEKSSAGTKTFVKDKDVGRNDPCPCGSGAKYKHCCGR